MWPAGPHAPMIVVAQSATETTIAPQLSGWRSGLDRFYCYASELFFAGVLAQVFLAGVGAFGDHASKVAKATSFDPHRGLGSVLGIVSVVLFIVALLVRRSRSTVIVAFVLGALTMGAQGALAGGGESNKWVGGLHALDGMAILFLSWWIARAAYRLLRPSTTS